MSGVLYKVPGVSIHALTRSATSMDNVIYFDWPVSIHALTRSATNQMTQPILFFPCFNPRTHEECDTA